MNPMRDIHDFRDEVQKDLKSAFPRHTIKIDTDDEAFNIEGGDIFLSLTYYFTTYDSLAYRAWAGDRWDNLEQVDLDTASRSKAILSLLAEYNKPRPTINDLVREDDEASL
jgi:hypothetical protein